MEAFLQKTSDTINKSVSAEQFGKTFPHSAEFDFTKFSGKRRRSETESKLSCSYWCSETENASPKMSIWDVYTKHDNFAKRKMLSRSKSGLCNESADKKGVERFSQIINVKPMNKEKNITDKDDSTKLLIKPKEVASDDEANKVQPKSNEAELTAKKQSIIYDSYDEEEPDIVPRIVTPKRLNFSESDESSNELSPSEENQQSSTKFTIEKKSTNEKNKCKAGWSVDEDDSPKTFKKRKLDEFQINSTKHVPTQPQNKKKKETKQDGRRQRA